MAAQNPTSDSATTRPVFDPVDTNTPRAIQEVESPSLSSLNALARFEFEAGRGNDGTKVLMIEFEEDHTTRGVPGEWEIKWEGKKTILPADDSNGPLHRLYFLLGAGTPVPPQIAISHRPSDANATPTVMRTNPLPAIFPPELLSSAREAGKKGVLHTIWAKKRLQSLQTEIEGEASTNTESVGLAMAVQEKDWIEQNFGVISKPTSIAIPLPDLSGPPISPSTPRSPGGGRLLEKLKGLKLGTGERDLQKNETIPPEAHPLSPETGDVAMSSFASIKGVNTLAAKPAQIPTTRKVMAQEPPQSILAQQQEQGTGMVSLNALTSGMPPPPATSSDNQEDDELFAVPMSARSPDMTKSPFSFAASDTVRYLSGAAQ